MDRDQLTEHLRFAGELGVAGVSRDTAWRAREKASGTPVPLFISPSEPFLFRQIDTIKPKVIVALGTFAARALLRTLDPISRLRGRVYDYRGAKLIPTFHPAYLLRNPSAKREVWEDMKLVKTLLT